MAGSAKPEYEVNKEARYTPIAGGYGNGSYMGLFDGTTPMDWTSNEIFYFNSPNAYIEIEFHESVILHRFYSWDNNNNMQLKIMLHDGEGYNIDLSHLHLPTAGQKPLTWMPFTEMLPKGKYRFSLNYSSPGTGRCDGEWYVEKAKNYKSLIRSNDDRYYYIDKVSEQWEPLGREVNEEDYINSGINNIDFINKRLLLKAPNLSSDKLKIFTYKER